MVELEFQHAKPMRQEAEDWYEQMVENIIANAPH